MKEWSWSEQEAVDTWRELVASASALEVDRLDPAESGLRVLIDLKSLSPDFNIVRDHDASEASVEAQDSQESAFDFVGESHERLF